MSDLVAGFPFWSLHFDKDGHGDATLDTFLSELPGAKLTDLFLFSHGWNNDAATAMELYTRFFGAMRDQARTTPLRQGVVIGTAGLFWPAILFPGDTAPAAADGGASSFSGGAPGDLAAQLPKAFCSPSQQAMLPGLLALLKAQPQSTDALLEFRDKLIHMVTLPQQASTQDDLEALTSLKNDQWLQLLDAAAEPEADSEGGTASFGGFFDKMWNGAKNVLRVATYWEMKNRAGVIGLQGLGPLLGKLYQAAPELKIHLLGHSFGARLVSYALAGLPRQEPGTASPVKLLFLLQGAFSHFTFADALPFDDKRSGDLHGMASRVDGPLLATHSLLDKAVGVAYPAASILAGQDASAFTDSDYRWAGMGHDGAQAVDAAGVDLGATPYAFVPGKWLNLDGNTIIVNGGPPSGAHGDIVHPETAYAALAGAGVV